MTVYAYNAPRLQKKMAPKNQKKTSPKKPFWSGNKIAVAASSLLILSFGVLVANAPNQPTPVAVTPAAPVAVTQAAPVASTEPENNMPEACIKAKVTREECDQAIALYNAQQDQGPTWSGQEFNENQRKAWAQ